MPSRRIGVVNLDAPWMDQPNMKKVNTAARIKMAKHCMIHRQQINNNCTPPKAIIEINH
jgi:hypothetical protein